MEIKQSAKWVYQQLFSKIDLQGKKLLDVGGGKAIVGFYYSNKLSKYVCVDTYEGEGNPKENLDIALRSIRDRNIKNMEIKKMSLEKYYQVNKKNMFDIALISNVLHHIFPSQALFDDVIEYFDLIAKYLKSPGGSLLIIEVFPLNISQVLFFLNKDKVNFSTKKFPSFWIKAIKKTNCFHNITHEYYVPSKLRMIHSTIKNLNFVRFFASTMSTSGYIIKAQRNENYKIS